MTLAKTCQASNYAARLGKKQLILQPQNCLNRDVSIVPLLYGKKIESRLKT